MGMRYLRAGGIVLSLCVLLCGMALQMDALAQAAVWLCLGAMAVCFLDRPPERASLMASAVCMCFAGMALLGGQAGTFVIVPQADGDMLIPAGESAVRMLTACLFAMLAGGWLGQTALEGLLGRNAFASRAGWAGLPVRICALLCALTGMAACAVPGLTEYFEVPTSVQTVVSLFGALATGGVACYVASARSKVAACAVLLLYMASAVFDGALFAQHAFFAAAFSLLLCARGNGRRVLACLLPVPALLAAVWLYRVDGSALSLYAQRLWQAVCDFLQPGGMEWALQIYARFGIYGFAVAGVLAGALLFLLGRLLRDSFLYAAPVLFALGWGCLVLLRGLDFAPTLPDYVFFGIAYGLCLIVGCVRRASAKKR